MHDKQKRERNHEQENVACNPLIYWNSCILRALKMPRFTLLAETRAPVSAQVSLKITGLYEEKLFVATNAMCSCLVRPYESRYHPGHGREECGEHDPKASPKMLFTTFDKKTNLTEWFIWGLREKDESRTTTYLCPFLEYLLLQCKTEIASCLYSTLLPVVLQREIILYLSLELLNVPREALFEWIDDLLGGYLAVRNTKLPKPKKKAAMRSCFFTKAAP